MEAGEQEADIVCRRSLLTQEGICLTLSPEFRFLEVAYPYVAKRLLTDEDPALRKRLIEVRSTAHSGISFSWLFKCDVALLTRTVLCPISPHPPPPTSHPTLLWSTVPLCCSADRLYILALSHVSHCSDVSCTATILTWHLVEGNRVGGSM